MSIGNPNDWDYNFESIGANKQLEFNDAVLQYLTPTGASRTVILPVGNNQGKGCVIIVNGAQSGANNIVVSEQHITNEGANISLGPQDAIKLDYFSRHPDDDESGIGFWVASSAAFDT